MKLLLGDCLDELKNLQNDSIDSIVTDPPYGLSFMGKKWDYDVPSQQIWEECLRVLKPGGHLLAFAGSRTYHRMAVRIEDAGFEIRDQIMWIYGSGFPKSHNIGKAVDKIQGNEREVGELKFKGGTQLGVINDDNWKPKDVYDSKGSSEWEGWGTALKPAHEPIVMARKPFKGTVAENVLEWGTGGINVDGCRIGTEKVSTHSNGVGNTGDKGIYGTFGNQQGSEEREGRFPANIIFDEEAGKILDEQSGISKSTGGRSGNKEGVGQNGIYGQYKGEVRDENPGLGDIGGASRFFYCPKTSKTDRNEGLGHLPISRPDTRTETGMGSFVDKGVQPQQNIHPTVKPTDLMLYLIRLVTPKGGTTLDPFMGSGSTGKGAIRGGFDFVGIERENEYFQIATARIQYEIDNPISKQKGKRVEVSKKSNSFW